MFFPTVEYFVFPRGYYFFREGGWGENLFFPTAIAYRVILFFFGCGAGVCFVLPRWEICFCLLDWIFYFGGDFLLKFYLISSTFCAYRNICNRLLFGCYCNYYEYVYIPCEEMENGFSVGEGKIKHTQGKLYFSP